MKACCRFRKEADVLKYVKYVITLFILSVVAACTGLICQLHVTTIPYPDYVEIHIHEEDSAGEILNSIKEAVYSSGASAFIYTLDNDKFETNFYGTAYCTDSAARKFVEDKCLMKEGTYKSVFLSDTVIEIKDIEEYPLSDGYVKVYYIGGDAEKTAFVSAAEKSMDVADKWENKDSNPISSEPFALQLVIWLFAIAIIGAVCLYEVSFMKGEAAVKYILGEKPFVIYLKKVVTDTLVFSVVGVLTFGVSSIFTSSLFSIKITLIMFALLVIANALFLLPLLRVDLHRGFASAYSSPALLSASYVLKLITCVLTIMVTAVSFGIISQTTDLRQQENIYKKYSNYSFLDVSIDTDKLLPMNSTGDEATKVSDDLWYDRDVFMYRLTQELFKEGKVLVQASIGNLGPGGQYDAVVCNRYAKENLIESIPELKNVNLDEETVYIITPEFAGYKEEVTYFFSPSLNGMNGYLFAHDFKPEIITYKSDIEFFAFYDNYTGGGKICKNPVICFSNIDESKQSVDCVDTDYVNNVNSRDGFISPLYGSLTIYEVSAEEVLDFARRDGYKLDPEFIKIDNVYETFLSINAKTVKVLSLACIILVMMLLLETCMISIVIKMEYTIHAKELAIKKVLGYGIFQRNLKIFAITFGVIGVGLTAALILNGFLKLANPVLIILGCLLLAAIETLIIIYNILKIEKSRIVKILKGGSL